MPPDVERAAATAVVNSAVAQSVAALGRIGPLLSDEAVSEVMVTAGVVWTERYGELHRTSLELDEREVAHLIERVVGPAGARVDRASPIVDVRLPDGSRANIVLPPIALDGPAVTIRRFVLRDATVADFAGGDVAHMLATAVQRRTNIVISGGTGSGKTTLLNALATHLPANERIVTVEDTAELRLAHPHVVRLQARPANSDGVGEVTIRTLVRTALRMRPDRIIVGEARGGEVLDVLQAMNTGHQGSMSSCHANSPHAALRRLEALALLGGDDVPARFVREQLATAVGLVVHVERTATQARRVASVVALDDDADLASGRGVRLVVDAGAASDAPSRPEGTACRPS